MTQGIVVGVDGTEQARAAAEWAADEAVLRGTGVHLVHVKEPSPELLLPFVSREPDESWAEDLLVRTAAELRARYPGLPVTTRLAVSSGPVPALVAAGGEAELLVLGSRALGSVAGYLLGSTGLTVAGAVDRPVVLVRAHGTTAPRGPVTVGVDVRQSADPILEFAFDEAARRDARVHVVFALQLGAFAGLGPAMVPDVRLAVVPELERSLDDSLAPWRAKYPEVAAVHRVVVGSAGQVLVEASGDASLVVVGRRTRPAALGAHIGSVAHAVLHHSRAPVAVVPHE
ncbi:universal stress protein [Streptomyces sp. NPDC093089]|uniref:universal stress protein n=1 Tax=Streptomyces sp. NPDC093089 TaxID=3366024 RepID=UPI0037F83C94